MSASTYTPGRLSRRSRLVQLENQRDCAFRLRRALEPYLQEELIAPTVGTFGRALYDEHLRVVVEEYRAQQAAT